MLFLIITLVEYISNVYLKKRVPRRKVGIFLDNSNFYRELASAYRDMGYEYHELTLFGNSCQHYELASFLVEDNGINTQYRLHVGEVVSIISKDDESFAIIRSIFSHERNDQHFAFIVIDRFEITNQVRLECPVYKLRNIQTICPISEVDTNNTAHFVHCCVDNECIGGRHNFRNDLYIRNMYYFKAV